MVQVPSSLGKGQPIIPPNRGSAVGLHEVITYRRDDGLAFNWAAKKAISRCLGWTGERCYS